MSKRVCKSADWVGQSITTESGVELKVVAHNGLSGNSSRHGFYCKVCAADPELFGDGVFWSRIHSITHKSATPCGCAVHPRWGERQYLVRAKRAGKARNLSVSGYSEPFRGVYTKLAVSCEKHGEINTLALNSLINSGHGCRTCYEARVSSRAISDEKLTRKYAARCGYPAGTTIERSARLTSGRRKHAIIKCPVCASDEFAQAGLCDGVFEVDMACLSAGMTSCRCGKTKLIREDIRAHQAEGLLSESGHKFLGWRDGYKNTKSKVVAECPEHGIYYPSVSTLLRGSRCPACSAGGYSVNKPGHCYLLKSECGSLLKIGISNDPTQRVKELVRFTPFAFELVMVKPMAGPKAPVVEAMIKRRFASAHLSGFNGASEWLIMDDAIPAMLIAATSRIQADARSRP